MRRCTSVAEELLPGHRAAPLARPISRLHPSVRPSVCPSSLILFDSRHLLHLLFLAVPSLLCLASTKSSAVLPLPGPPRVGVLRKGRGVEGGVRLSGQKAAL